MAWQTPKNNWAAGDGVANGDLNRIEENVRMLSQSAGAFGTCTGSANAYSVTASPPLTSLSDGACVAVKINVTNTAGSTINVNGLGAKAIKKGNGLDVAAGQLKAGSIYTLRYNGVNFTLQGEGGSGNATASDLLSGKTASVDAGDIVGTMPDRGTVNHSLPINGSYTIPDGKHSGSGKVTQSITTKGAQTYTPGTSNQTIASGQYLTGTQTIKGDANLVSANIKSGVSIFGKIGSLVEGRKIATGTGSLILVSTASAKLTVTGLLFTPSEIYLKGTLRARYSDSVFPEGNAPNHMVVEYAIYKNVIVPESRNSNFYTIAPNFPQQSNYYDTITIKSSIDFQSSGFTVTLNQTSPTTRGLDQYGVQNWIAIE